MGSTEHADSRGTYAWWWDSHIVPKHSKWLQQSLSDMDDKILAMLDLIKEDGDSFAMRAQMFYQRKPKLRELIEQFHRAYRALAERYDHASGAIRQVRDSMIEASDATLLLDSDSNEMDVGKFLDKISNLQESVSQSEIEIEKLKQCLGRVEAERDAAVEKYNVAESKVESLRVAVAETREERDAFALQCRDSLLKISAMEESNRELQDSVKKMELPELEDVSSPEDLRVHRVLEDYTRDLENKIKNSDKNLKRVSSVPPISSRLKDQNLRLRVIAKNLEADIEHQVKYQNSLHQEIDRLKNEADSLRVEADEARQKVRVLEESQQSLVSERAFLAFQLEIVNDNKEKLEQKNANLEAFSNRMKGLEASWSLLLHEKLSLIAEKEALEGRYRELKNERETVNVENSQLRFGLGKERKQHEELETALNREISILKNTVQGLEDRSSKLSLERVKLVDLCRSFEERLLDLEHEILKRESEMKSLADQLEGIIDQNLESAVERSVLYTVIAQMGSELESIKELNERINFLGRQNLGLESEVTKIVAEREKDASSLVQNMVLGSIRESAFEDHIRELIEAYHSLRESKARDIKLLHERIHLLEGQNVRLSSVFASCYMTAEEASSTECHEVDSLEIKDMKQIPRDKPEILGLTPDSSSSSTEGLKHRDHDREKISHSENGSTTKDILECGGEGTDDRMLELWETSDGSGTIDLKVGIRSRNHRRLADCNFSRESSPCLSERELNGSMERKFCEASRKRSARKVLERLSSDVQKLTNLQITLQDLRRKVDSTDYITEEYDNLKEQLEAVEVAIMTFFDTNRKLTKSVQKVVKSMEGDSHGSRSGGSVMRVSEQAWKIGEEIGRQQRKLQRIQWLLVKLDEENKKGRRRCSGGNAGGTRIINVSERNPKVLLKDILHVRMKKNLKKKKGQFCACVGLPSRL